MFFEYEVIFNLLEFNKEIDTNIDGLLKSKIKGGNNNDNITAENNIKENNFLLLPNLQKLAEKECGYVYIATSFSDMKQNLFKIGCAKSLKSRLSSLNSSRSFSNSLFFIITIYCD